MKIDVTTILIIGGAALAGYWCFTQGPCKDFLNKKEEPVAPTRAVNLLTKNITGGWQQPNAVMRGAM